MSTTSADDNRQFALKITQEILHDYTFGDSAVEHMKALLTGAELVLAFLETDTVEVSKEMDKTLGEPIYEDVHSVGPEEVLSVYETMYGHPECEMHHEVQHRDGNRPWCNACGWNQGNPSMAPKRYRYGKGSDK